MMASVQDPKELARVSPEEVTTYLLAHGWRLDPSAYEAAHLWTLPTDGETAELLAPSNATSGDYALRLSEALKILSAVEGRSEIEILRDFYSTQVDVIRLRRPTQLEGQGTIPLVDGVSLVEHAMALVTAAACSAVTPRRVVPSRRPALAQDYLRKVRLGQTEQGSFVLTVVSPVAPLLTPGSPGLYELMDEPFPRRVTRTLARALQAAKVAATHAAIDGSYEGFEAGVEMGISADLCEALTGLIDATGEQGHVTVELAWAVALTQPGNESRIHEFAAGEGIVLTEAARRLREASPMEGVAITGVVTRLHRQHRAEAGVITVSCVLEGNLRQLTVALDAMDYPKALDAHRDSRGVFFRADITQLARRYYAENVVGFRIVD